MLSIAFATQAHWEEISAVLARVWGEDDYVAESWLDWLEHPEEGLSIVALWDDVPVGTAHVAFHDDGVLWFHAMRIDPAYQGKGIAGEMNRFAIAELKQRGYTCAYAAIDIENLPSQKAARKSGFELLYTYSALTTQLKSDSATTPPESTLAAPHSPLAEIPLWSRAPLSDVGSYLALLKPHLKPPREWLMIGWEICAPEEEDLAEALCWGETLEDSCFLRRWSSDTADAWAAIYDFDEFALIMSPACSDISQWPAALQGLQATLGGQPFHIWLTPDDPLYDPTLQAGYRVDPENGYQIWKLVF